VIKENPKVTILVANITYVIGLACQLGLNFLIFKQLPLDEIGSYNLIMSLALFAGFVMDLGISQTLIRGFSQNTLGFSQAVWGALALRIPLVVLGLGALVIWLYLKSSLGHFHSALLGLAILAQTLLGFRAIPTAWLRAHDRQNCANIINLLPPFCYFCLAFLLFYFHQFNLLLFFSGILMVEIAVTAMAFLATGQVRLPGSPKESFSPSHIKTAVGSLWKPSLIFSVVTFCELLQSRLDCILVYYFRSGTELAYYSLATKIFEVFEYTICLPLQTSLPWLCKMAFAGEQNPTVTFWLKIFSFLGIVLAVAAALYLPAFLTVFWGDKFANTDNLIFLIMCGACLNPVYSMISLLLVTEGKERFLLIASIVPVSAQLAINLVLIPPFGGLGAALGMLVFFSMTFLILTNIAFKTRLIETLALLRIILLLVVIFSVLIISRQFFAPSSLTNIIVLSFIILVGLVVLINRSDWRLMLDLLRNASKISP